MLDIQKLAAEMGLSCIKTFKLDALKSVCRRHEIDTSTGPCCSNASDGVINDVSGSPNMRVETMSSIVTDRLKTETVEENGG